MGNKESNTINFCIVWDESHSYDAKSENFLPAGFWTAMPRVFSMTIKKEFAVQIWDNKKSLEARPRRHRQMEQVSVEDEMVFHWCSKERLVCTVEAITFHQNMRQALTVMGVARFLPACNGLDEAVVAGSDFRSCLFFLHVEKLRGLVGGTAS